MTLITLIHSDEVTLASDQRVFSAEETGALRSVVETATAISSVLRDTETQLKKAENEARTAGYQAGLAEGRQAAAAEHTEELLKLATKAQKDHLLQQQQAVTLAMQIVRKIAADLAPEQTLLALASSAARECSDVHRVVLKVHPERLTAVEQALDEVQHRQHDAVVITDVVADPSLALEGCTIETPLGSIVADLDTQLEVLKRNLSSTSA